MASFNPHTATAQAPRVATQPGVAHEGRSSHSGSPLLSIVVPTRHEEANVVALVAALEHILADVTMEIIVVDDSDDATPEAVLAVSRTSTRDVRLLHVSTASAKAASAEPSSRASAWLGGPGCASWTVTCSTHRRPWRDCWRAPRPRMRQIVVASRFCANGGTRCIRTQPADAVQRLLGGRPHDVPAAPAPRDRPDERVLPRAPRRARPGQAQAARLQDPARDPRADAGLRRAEVPFVFGERQHGESKAGMREGLRYLRPAVGAALLAGDRPDGALRPGGRLRPRGQHARPRVPRRRGRHALPAWPPSSRRRSPRPGTSSSRRAGSSAGAPDATGVAHRAGSSSSSTTSRSRHGCRCSTSSRPGSASTTSRPTS